MSKKNKRHIDNNKRDDRNHLLSSIDDENHRKDLSAFIAAQCEISSGPLPHPSTFAEYGKALSSAPERILVMAENEQLHRHKMDEKKLFAEIQLSKWGVISAFFIGIVGIIGSVICIINGYTVGGSILGSGTLGGMITTFIYGTQSKRKEKETRLKHLTQPNSLKKTEN